MVAPVWKRRSLPSSSSDDDELPPKKLTKKRPRSKINNSLFSSSSSDDDEELMVAPPSTTAAVPTSTKQDQDDLSLNNNNNNDDESSVDTVELARRISSRTATDSNPPLHKNHHRPAAVCNKRNEQPPAKPANYDSLSDFADDESSVDTVELARRIQTTNPLPPAIITTNQQRILLPSSVAVDDTTKATTTSAAAAVPPSEHQQDDFVLPDPSSDNSSSDDNDDVETAPLVPQKKKPSSALSALHAPYAYYSQRHDQTNTTYDDSRPRNDSTPFYDDDKPPVVHLRSSSSATVVRQGLRRVTNNALTLPVVASLMRQAADKEDIQGFSDDDDGAAFGFGTIASAQMERRKSSSIAQRNTTTTSAHNHQQQHDGYSHHRCKKNDSSRTLYEASQAFHHHPTDEPCNRSSSTFLHQPHATYSNNNLDQRRNDVEFEPSHGNLDDDEAFSTDEYNRFDTLHHHHHQPAASHYLAYTTKSLLDQHRPSQQGDYFDGPDAFSSDEQQPSEREPQAFGREDSYKQEQGDDAAAIIYRQHQHSIRSSRNEAPPSAAWPMIAWNNNNNKAVDTKPKARRIRDPSARPRLTRPPIRNDVVVAGGSGVGIGSYQVAAAPKVKKFPAASKAKGKRRGGGWKGRRGGRGRGRGCQSSTRRAPSGTATWAGNTDDPNLQHIGGAEMKF